MSSERISGLALVSPDTVEVELLCAATAEEAVTLSWRLEDRAGGSSVTEATCVCHVDTSRVTQTITVTLTDQGPGMVHSCQD